MTPIPRWRNVSAILALVALLALPGASLATSIRIQTSLGVVDIQLFDTAAPLTVANFLDYVNSGAYDNSFIHRSVPGFIIQGGGYTWDGTQPSRVPARAPVANEFSSSRPNVRGTIAMAKVGGDPNSATSEWFINLANNSANLDAQNGGFTVFGQVIGNGMAVIDAIAALETRDAGSGFENLPLTSIPPTGRIQTSNLVMVNKVSAAAPGSGGSDSDRLFAYLEGAYPQYLSPAYPLSPATAFSATALGYYYRYYPSTNAYVGTANGTVYYLVPAFGNQIQTLGTLADWLATASRAGY